MSTPAARGRLLFVAPSAYPLGGLATWLDGLMPALEERGWGVTLGLTAGAFHDPDAYLRRHPWTHVVPIANPTGSAEGRVRAMRAAIEQVAPRLVASVNVPDCLEAAGSIDGTRAVMTLHGIQEDLVAETGRLEGWIDGVICTNRLACELVHEVSSVRSERVFYAPYGVDVPSALPDPPAPSSELRILYAGRLEEEQKRVFDLPEILRALDRRGVQWSLRIAGSGPDEDKLTGRLASAGLSARVESMGAVPRERLLDEFLPAADVLLLTSRWETGPLVAWEAMAAGVVVASSRYIGCGREGSLLHDHNCVLFPIGDTEEAAAQLDRLRGPSLRGSLRSRAFSLVSNRYSRGASADAWDHALRSLAALPAAPRRTLSRRRPAGRLDRWVGPGVAETTRALLGRRFPHVEPGGEWPHAYSPASDSDFWARARQADG